MRNNVISPRKNVEIYGRTGRYMEERIKMKRNGEGWEITEKEQEERTRKKRTKKEKENSPNKHILVLPTHGLFWKEYIAHFSFISETYTLCIATKPYDEIFVSSSSIFV